MRSLRVKATAVLAVALAASCGLPVAAFGAAEVLANFKPFVGSAEDAMVPMSDGVRLWTTVYLPKGATGRVPVILVRTPYSFALEAGHSELLEHLLQQGYGIVLQDERGRFWSEGRYSLLAGARDDGYDTVDWISKQPWSNGRVGTYGCSSSGDNQVLLMTRPHPAHRAAIVASAGSSIGVLGPFHEQGLFYRGGSIQLLWGAWFAALGQRDFPKFPPGISTGNRDALASAALKGGWMEDLQALAVNPPDLAALPAATVGDAPGGQRTDWDDFVGRRPNDPAWQTLRLLGESDRIGVPALWVMQAHDVGVAPQLAGFEHALGTGAVPGVAEQQRAIISPLGHCSMFTETEHTIDGERAIGDARFPYVDAFTRWFDEKLRDVPAATPLPRMQVYVPGADRWQTFANWPPRSTGERLYLDSARGANTRLGDGRLVASKPGREHNDQFTYDPRDPVPSVGGDVLLTALPGSFDHADLEMRKDVLVYSSAPLDRPITVVGMTEVQLEISSDAPDTDFTANLVDIAPDGKTYVLAGSIQRARWREGYDHEVRMLPAGIYPLRVGPFFVTNRFLRGHRVALEVSSSSVPRFERNMNTGGTGFDEVSGRSAINAVHLGGAHASFVTIPVVPDRPMK